MMTADPLIESSASGEAEDYVVQQQGDILFVIGTDVADDIDLDMSGDVYLLTINGVEQSISPVAVDQIVIAGMAERDEVHITTGRTDERIEVFDDELEIISANYAVRVQQSEIVEVMDEGGDDLVRYYDSAGNDQLVLDPEVSTFTNSKGERYQVTGAEVTQGYAINGGSDVAIFYDSAGNDRFVGKETFSYMVGEDFSNLARSFEQVVARKRAGGTDEARLYGSDSDDLLIANPEQVSLQSNNTDLSAFFFDVTRSYAGEGNDRAELHGQGFVTDRFVWEPTSSYLYTTGVVDPAVALANLPADFEPLTVSNVAIGFDVVEGFGGDGSDRAELKGSAGDDNYIALPEIVQLSTPNAMVEATNFRIVRAFGRGGDDQAYLEDSKDNDTYISNEVFAYLEGRDYLNYVSEFKIQVIAKNGGFDYANPRGYRGPDRDYLLFDGFQFLIYGPERRERIFGFDDGRGDASTLR